jgi:hypothetical protein
MSTTTKPKTNNQYYTIPYNDNIPTTNRALSIQSGRVKIIVKTIISNVQDVADKR